MLSIRVDYLPSPSFRLNFCHPSGEKRVNREWLPAELFVSRLAAGSDR